MSYAIFTFLEFRIKNKLERDIDLQNVKIEYEKEWERLKETRKGVERLFNGFPPSTFKKYTRNRKNRIQLNEKDKTYSHRLKQRLAYWRTKQKELALQFLRNNKQEASNDNIFQTPFTFLLSDLLVLQ